MRLFKKSAALALAAAMALSSAQLAVFAAPETPELSATVTELNGNDLVAENTNGVLPAFGLNSMSVTGLEEGSGYTMNKAVSFKTEYDYTDFDENGKKDEYMPADMRQDIETYGNWICDFKINILTDANEEHKLTGDEIILIGNYGGYANIGFIASKLVEKAGYPYLPANGEDNYYLMQMINLAVPKVSTQLTYAEVAKGVRDFKCGIVDNGLEPYSKVTVQLVMFAPDDVNRTEPVEIGDPVIYEKIAKPSEPKTEVIPVGELDAEVQEIPAQGETGVEVTGIKDSMLATEKTKLINDYIVDNNIEKPAEGTYTVDVDIFAETEALSGDDFYKLTPYAKITCEDATGAEEKVVEISNDQLKDNAAITVTIPVSAEPLYILHRTNEGALIDKYTEGAEATGTNFTYDGSTCTLKVNHFSTLQAVTDTLVITDVDAYVDNQGTGNLRFITTYAGTDVPTSFGTWIVANDYFEDGNGAKYESSASISDGATFTADLMEIPSTMLDKFFYAMSYVNVGGVDTWTKTEKEASVNQYKNDTSY